MQQEKLLPETSSFAIVADHLARLAPQHRDGGRRSPPSSGGLPHQRPERPRRARLQVHPNLIRPVGEPLRTVSPRKRSDASLRETDGPPQDCLPVIKESNTFAKKLHGTEQTGLLS